MATKFFIDPMTGEYMGGYDGPDDQMPDRFRVLAEVLAPPEHAQDTWNGTSWDTSTRQESVVRKRERLLRRAIMKLVRGQSFTQAEEDELEQIL